MELIGDDNETNGFSFIWTIQNFSYCVQKANECLQSPCFALDASGYKCWRLELFPRGFEVSDTAGFRLQRVFHPCKEINPYVFPEVNKQPTSFSFGHQQPITGFGFGGNQQPTTGLFGRNQQPTTGLFGRNQQPTTDVRFSANFLKIDYVLSIRTVKGSFTEMVHKNLLYENSSSNNCFLKLQEIHKRGTGAYLDDDTLTVRCRICKVDGVTLTSQQCYARTVIGVERTTYNWNLKTPGNLKTIKQQNLSEIPSFTVDVSMSKGILGEDKFQVVIKTTEASKLYFSTCAISLLDSEKLLQSVRNEHWFDNPHGNQVWTVSFTPKNNLPTQPDQNSTLSLLCEFAVSFAVKYSEIESTVNGDITKVRPFGSLMDPDALVPKTVPDIRGCWKDNLLSFYSEGKLSDFTIRTPRKKFPVHKIMLCAQSAVFRAMFEGEMKENRTGIVEIEDLEDDTLSMMLAFVYTGTVDNLDWVTASKLYFAADKYEMTPLKEQCSSFIKNNLSTSNACECLILADIHNDQDLKSVVQDFVMEHSTEIISSDEWTELIKVKSQLAAETMHSIFMRNFKA